MNGFPPPIERPPVFSPPPDGGGGVIWLAYALHCCVFFTGGISCVAALIINYIKRGDQNLLMSSHMQWQIDTFWRAAAGCLVLGLVCLALALTVVGLVFVYPLLLILGIWFAYRQIRGMLALSARRPVY